MTARVQVQACGCIALPEDMARATGIDPGAVLELQLREDAGCEVVRASEPLVPGASPPSAACPLP